jgi:hypothetical protein
MAAAPCMREATLRMVLLTTEGQVISP